MARANLRQLARSALAGVALVTLGFGPSAAGEPVSVDQGVSWTAAARTRFYSQDQGSQIMPLAWFQALRQPNGTPFLSEGLGRYGYLANPASPTPGLPVGFTVNGSGAATMVGMTCAACHTRQIDANGVAYRIDGGPAIVDFQSFLQDLDTAVANTLNVPAEFAAFASAVLGPSPAPPAVAALKSAVALWFLRYDTLMKAALPTPYWGASRLDAVSMIFNRLTGLDLGPPPSYLIASNIRPATAPVRYPFLWNAAIQDHTQWPGFANNGDTILSLGRNLGEVFGVFATYEPRKAWYGTDFLANNSADFPGLFALGSLMRKIGAPRWPWAVNQTLASRGAAVFNRSTANGGCVACHGIQPGVTRFFEQKTWLTPILNVGTDTREAGILALTAQSGVLNSSFSLIDPTPLKPVDASISILGASVLGSIEQYCILNPLTCAANFVAPGVSLGGASVPQLLLEISASAGNLYQVQPSASYESRVLQGIWAAAPYLHNGSVPSLQQILTPSAQRTMRFAVGPNYDTTSVGLSAVQSFGTTFQATGCDNLNSGNSNCGHDYGTALSAPDKAALLEYLKTL